MKERDAPNGVPRSRLAQPHARALVENCYWWALLTAGLLLIFLGSGHSIRVGDASFRWSTGAVSARAWLRLIGRQSGQERILNGRAYVLISITGLPDPPALLTSRKWLGFFGEEGVCCACRCSGGDVAVTGLD